MAQRWKTRDIDRDIDSESDETFRDGGTLEKERNKVRSYN